MVRYALLAIKKIEKIWSFQDCVSNVVQLKQRIVGVIHSKEESVENVLVIIEQRKSRLKHLPDILLIKLNVLFVVLMT